MTAEGQQEESVVLKDIYGHHDDLLERYGNTICAHRKVAPRKILISLPNLTDARTHNF
jgi:hypothetical protein